jgi:transcriptional regulator with XRE-family HTH domain
MPPVPIVSQDGAAIRACRVRRGLTLEALARLTGRHPKALGHLERETRSASAVMLNQIANALGVEPEDLTKHGDVNGTAA